MTLRVLILTPTLSRGGAERHAVLLATELGRDRVEAQVLSLADGPLRAELEAAGVRVTLAGGVGRGLRSLPAAAAAVRRAVADFAPDVISCHDIMVELATRAEMRRRPRPLLIWKHTYGNSALRQRREQVMERASSRLVTRYGAVCHTQVRYLTDDLGLDPRRIRVVANAVPDQSAAPAPQGPPTVAMVGAMRADKDHRSVISAWSEVVRAVPAARLVLVGDGPLRGEIEAQVQTLGLHDSVRIVGESAAPLDHVRQAHALVIASYAVECFPYAALEALSVGRPVVATTVGGLPELVQDGHTGLLVPPRDTAALTRALADVVGDLDYARRLGDAGHDSVRHHLPFTRWTSAALRLLDETAGATTPR